jgi:hypothetical protein
MLVCFVYWITSTAVTCSCKVASGSERCKAVLLDMIHFVGSKQWPHCGIEEVEILYRNKLKSRVCWGIAGIPV